MLRSVYAWVVWPLTLNTIFGVQGCSWLHSGQTQQVTSLPDFQSQSVQTFTSVSFVCNPALRWNVCTFFDKITKFGPVIAFDVLINIRYRPTSILPVNNDFRGCWFYVTWTPTKDGFFLASRVLYSLNNSQTFHFIVRIDFTTRSECSINTNLAYSYLVTDDVT